MAENENVKVDELEAVEEVDENKDDTDWRFKASRELTDKLNRQRAILGHATPVQRAKLEQLSWLRKNDPAFHKEAERQYQALWCEVEADWMEQGSRDDDRRDVGEF